MLVFKHEKILAPGYEWEPYHLAFHPEMDKSRRRELCKKPEKAVHWIELSL